MNVVGAPRAKVGCCWPGWTSSPKTRSKRDLQPAQAWRGSESSTTWGTSPSRLDHHQGVPTTTRAVEVWKRLTPQRNQVRPNPGARGAPGAGPPKRQGETSIRVSPRFMGETINKNERGGSAGNGRLADAGGLSTVNARVCAGGINGRNRDRSDYGHGLWGCDSTEGNVDRENFPNRGAFFSQQSQDAGVSLWLPVNVLVFCQNRPPLILKPGNRRGQRWCTRIGSSPMIKQFIKGWG